MTAFSARWRDPARLVTTELTQDASMMRGVMNRMLPEAPTMLFADCPLCDGPAPLDLESGALDCHACCVRLELADGPVIRELAPAA
ncbi:MAG: hypothetical protein ACYC65_04530 [Candidatus Limnocylindrales bacterium]